MNRRECPDGLPFRVYQRYGTRTYSIGFKSANGTWAFRLKCDVEDAAAIQKTRADALRRHASMLDPVAADDSFFTMSEAFFARQESFPLNSPDRRAESTLIENRREAKNLEKTFGGMNVHQFMPMHAYQYLDACEAAGRGQKGNKEITLAHLMFENYVRLDKLPTNPFAGVKKTKSAPSTRLVTETELDFVLRVGRSVGGNRHLAALALWTGYLCVRRSGELLSLRRSQIHEEKGISWTANKGQGSQISLKGTIVWSDTLRKTINEALAFKRYAGAPDEFVFGNLAGQRYTKGGWKKTLSYLMSACADAAESQGRPFERFNLRDCRPAGVTEKLNNKDSDVMEATMHTSEVTMRRNYDRRRTCVAKPTK